MIRKELRALAPTWLAIAVAMVAADYTYSSLRGLGPVVYFLGAVALGAQVIGHEFSHRTVSSLLTQPVSRDRILVTKLGVLAALLAALAGIAALVLPFHRIDPPFIAGMIALPCALGVFVAPWFTMAARSSLAGSVFPVALTGIVLLTGNWFGVRRHGYTRDVDTFTFAFMSWTMGGLCVTGAVMTWWSFRRLQMTEGITLGIRAWPAARRAATGSFMKRNPVWMLVMKELHLQQLALMVALVYVVGYLLVFTFDSAPASRGDSVTAGTILYAGILALLIGALASAEERQLGTHEWQQLVPMAAWQQWMVKAGAAIGLALVLGLGLPLLLVSLLPPEHVAWTRRGWPIARPMTFILVATATAGSLYVSSLTRSGLWALVMTLPAAFGVTIFLSWVSTPIERAVHAAGLRGTIRLALPVLAGNAVFLVLFAALIGMVLRFGLANHRSSDRSASRVSQQVAWMMVWTVAGLAAVLVLGAI